MVLDVMYPEFQSTPPARGATKFVGSTLLYASISIHAPREGGDQGRFRAASENDHFNPRPPRGGRPRQATSFMGEPLFQSTPPARGATVGAPKSAATSSLFQSTPPARGATVREKVMQGQTLLFQSTPPARGATSVVPFCSSFSHHFNPRPPRGGRLDHNAVCAAHVVFQSTPPARGATLVIDQVWHRPDISLHAPREGGDHDFLSVRAADGISIHAPREGGDYARRQSGCTPQDFNPRPPRGGRRRNDREHYLDRKFQSTPPARGATQGSTAHRRYPAISIHAPREGGDSSIQMQK